MKHDQVNRFQAMRLARLLPGAVCLLAVVQASFVLAATNPYEAITARNAFGIKPPEPPRPPELPKTTAPEIKLQGITTILGRKQVLLRTKLPAKPPEQPQSKDVSYVLSEGQREGEIEILEINDATGTIKLSNYGTIQDLNLKDNADKPAVVAASPPAVSGVPSPIAGGVPPPAVPAPAGIPAIGGQQRTIPTRSLRTTGAEGGAAAGVVTPGAVLSEQQQMAGQRTPEENVALRLINEAKNQQSGRAVPRIRDPRLDPNSNQ